MGGMSLIHWLILAAIVLLIFGPAKLPGLGKSLGEAIRGFKKELDGGDEKSNEVETNHRIAKSEDRQKNAVAEEVLDDEKHK